MNHWERIEAVLTGEATDRFMVFFEVRPMDLTEGGGVLVVPAVCAGE
ncbi:hypothetical protein ACFLQ0_02665 [Nitrospinota bacterium]